MQECRNAGMQVLRILCSRAFPNACAGDYSAALIFQNFSTIFYHWLLKCNFVKIAKMHSNLLWGKL